MAAGDPLLILDKVDKHFGGLHVITDFDFEVREEEIVGLIGPNGAGKSTVFNLITSIYPIDSGSITFKGKNIGRAGSSQDLPSGDLQDLSAGPGLPQDVGLRQRHDRRGLRGQAPR